jgi:hypothetical protein
MTEYMHHLWDAAVLWFHLMWKWIVGGVGAVTLMQVKDGLGIALTAVLIVGGIFNAIKAWREINKK